MLAEIRTLYDYSTWANGRILDTADRLGLKQFIAANGGSGSIREILAHTAWAQWTWLGRWQGAAPRPHWPPLLIEDCQHALKRPRDQRIEF